MSIYVQIATPIGPVWEGSAQSVILPNSDGDIGILSGHVPMTLFLKLGILRIRVDWQWVVFFVREGFAQVEGDLVTVLVNSAEQSEYIDLQCAQTELAMAQSSLKKSQNNNGKTLLATRQLQIAQTRLRAAEASTVADKTRELAPRQLKALL